MNIQEQIQQDLKTAMRGGERQRVEVLRMALAALKDAQIAQVKAAYDAAASIAGDEASVDRTAGISEAAMQDTIAREVKRRRDAVDAYRKANRDDLAAQEESEAEILGTYLPKQLSIDELRPLITDAIHALGATGPGDMGKIMPKLMQQFKGQADGRVISQVAREVLK